ncbi:MAG: putative sulfate exporter family transporter [Gammaproteobacteria bacterium]|nr:putative sulfate exporter family transporter [Gammaproteobacteria bacterium]MYF29024.1 putative sulfate exporter family transporter [Gammaproteobacteria bacterium]MYK45845.1 putative sulfate exporter family transporter [Gammaproteobacteria bacterium]
MFNRLVALVRPDALKWTLALIAFVGVLWVGHPALALFVGATMSVALAPAMPAIVERGGKLCLKSAIVVLGFTLNIEALWETSRDYSGLVVVFVACTLIAGLVIGRLMKVDDDQSRLLSTGTAICGGTAIVTLAPVIRARPESVAICIGIVFILNAIAIIVLPWVGHQLQMTQDQFGVWVALAIHDTSSVVGAAAIFGDRALETATTVKLVRTLLLIPVVLVAGILLRQSETKLRIPAFLALFVAASIAGTLLQPSAEVVAGVKSASRFLLIVALFFIGMEIRRSTITSLNGRAIWLSLLLWSFLLPVTLLAAMFW